MRESRCVHVGCRRYPNAWTVSHQCRRPAKARDPVRRGLSVQSINVCWHTGSPPSRGRRVEAVAIHLRVLAAQRARGLHRRCPSKRGSRECRVLAAPAVSCAIVRKEHAHEHTGAAGTLRHSLRNGFTAYIVLSPENGSFASVAREKRSLSRNLTPAPRRQDHTTSPYASCAFVCCALRVHRIPPHVRDDREAPFIRRETRGVKSLICPTARAEYFCARGWTDFRSDLPVGLFCRTRHRISSLRAQRSNP